jgi:SAM-dependent methyltransferase
MNPAPLTGNREVFAALPTAVQWSHLILSPRLRPGDLVVDATAGNGHDTRFLAERVLPGGTVFAFDLQADAIEETRATLGDHASEDVILTHAGHERMAEFLPAEAWERLRAVMFNLGYLPGGDKAVITRTKTTLDALQQAIDWLAPDGMLTLVAYPGHAGGREEASAVELWAAGLPSDRFEAQRLGFLNFRETTPFCVAIRKRV